MTLQIIKTHGPDGRKIKPEERFFKFVRKIQYEIMGAPVRGDVRMTEAQRHEAVVRVLGCEPLIMDSKLVHLAMDKRSDFYGTVPLPLLHRWLCDIHDRINPAPDRAMRKRDEGDNQFELNFEWQDGVAVLEAAE